MTALTLVRVAYYDQNTGSRQLEPVRRTGSNGNRLKPVNRLTAAALITVIYAVQRGKVDITAAWECTNAITVNYSVQRGNVDNMAAWEYTNALTVKYQFKEEM